MADRDRSRGWMDQSSKIECFAPGSNAGGIRANFLYWDNSDVWAATTSLEIVIVISEIDIQHNAANIENKENLIKT